MNIPRRALSVREKPHFTPTIVSLRCQCRRLLQPPLSTIFSFYCLLDLLQLRLRAALWEELNWNICCSLGLSRPCCLRPVAATWALWAQGTLALAVPGALANLAKGLTFCCICETPSDATDPVRQKVVVIPEGIWATIGREDLCMSSHMSSLYLTRQK